MAAPTSQQYRTIALTTRAFAILVFLTAVAVPVIRVVLERPIAPLLPVAFLLAVAAAGLLVASVGARRKAEVMEGRG